MKKKFVAAIFASALVVPALSVSPALALSASEAEGLRVYFTTPSGAYYGLGPEPSVKGTDLPAYCVEIGKNDPSGVETVSVATLTAPTGSYGQPAQFKLTTPQMAWLLEQHMRQMTATNQQALAFLVHMNFEQTQPGRDRAKDIRELYEYVQGHYPQVWQLATTYAQQARSSAAVGYSNSSVTGDNARTGQVQNLGVKSATGYVAGIPMTLTLNGPAVWAENNQKTITFTSASQPLAKKWVGTGNGEVTVKATYKQNVRKTLSLADAGGAVQKTVTYGFRSPFDPVEVSQPGPSWRVWYDFQPVATSKADHPKFGAKSVSDSIAVGSKDGYGNGQWYQVNGKAVPVKFTGKLYKLENYPSELENAKLVATKTVTADGPGDYAAVAEVSEPGIYNWVWSVAKSDQGENAQYIHADWSDGFGLEAETQILPTKAKITSDRNLISVMNGSDAKSYLHDVITQAGFPDNHGDFKGFGDYQADVATVDHSLYCVPGKVTEGVTKDMKPIFTATTPAKNGKFKIAEFVEEPGLHVQDIDCRGTLVFVSNFAGDARVEPLRTSDLDTRESYVPIVPSLGTTALDKADNDKYLAPVGPQTITDKVCYRELAAGKEYTLSGEVMDKATGKPLSINGKPVSATRKFTPTHKDGCTSIEFTVPGEAVVGKALVVFETATREGKEPIIHANIEDQAQTVYVPKIGTKANDKADGDQQVSAGSDAIIIDTVSFVGLQPGKQYTLVATLMDKATGKPLTLNGKPVTATSKFTPKASSGNTQVEIKVPGQALKGDSKFVVFETVKADGKTVTVHADINDKGQTITVVKPPVPPLAQTGASGSVVAGVAGVMTLIGASVFVLRRRASI